MNIGDVTRLIRSSTRSACRRSSPLRFVRRQIRGEKRGARLSRPSPELLRVRALRLELGEMVDDADDVLDVDDAVRRCSIISRDVPREEVVAVDDDRLHCAARPDEVAVLVNDCGPELVFQIQARTVVESERLLGLELRAGEVDREEMARVLRLVGRPSRVRREGRASGYRTAWGSTPRSLRPAKPAL